MILKIKGFRNLWSKWIKGCISTTNFSIIINGQPRGKIKATRWLRKGDPLSPFFVIVMDYYSRMMIEAHDHDCIKAFYVGRNLLPIHLLFANNTILFTENDLNSIKNLFSLVKIFEDASVLNTNHQKSELVSTNMTKADIRSIATSHGWLQGWSMAGYISRSSSV